MSAAAWAGVFASLVTVVNCLSVAIAAFRYRRRSGVLAVPAGAPPVSIVRPVRGIESFSEETLARGFTLDYPHYELIFCVADSDDPVLPLVTRLMAAHPEVPSRLVIGDERVSGNPKLNNCVRGWDAALHDWVILADSNVLMPPDYVQRLLAAWRPNTGLVCSTPVGSRPDGFWAEVECAFLNTLQARWQYTGECIGFGFAQGKSMLWQKSFLERHGGIRALGAEIAEDAAATKLVRAAGRRVHLVDEPFEQPLGLRSAEEVWSRQHRWARLRRVTFPVFFFPEIASGAVLPFAAAWFAGASAGGPAAAVASGAAVLLAWYGADFLLALRMGWHLSWRMPFAFAIRDVLIPAMWVYAWIGGNIVWQGNVMDIRPKTSARARA
jgi:ceramide glucosyltransferase